MTIHKRLNWLLKNWKILDRIELKVILSIADGIDGTGTLNDEDIKEYLEYWQINNIKKIYNRYAENSEEKD